MLTAAAIASHPKTDAEWRTKWEADLREQEARLEYGRTVGDLKRMLKRARRTMCAIRIGAENDRRDVVYAPMTIAALRRILRIFNDDEPMACELDPATGALTVGTLRAIDKAREAQSQ